MVISDTAKKVLNVAISSLTVLIGINGVARSFFNDVGIELSTDFYVSTLLIFLGFTIPYLISVIEKSSDDIESLNKLSKAELIDSQDNLFKILANESVLSQEIYTHMLSEPPSKIGPNAVYYFDSVHKYIREGSITKFSRIVSVNDEDKAKWIFDTLLELKDANSFSLAIKFVDHVSPLTTIHLCVNEKSPSVFVWPTVVAGGQGKAFFVKNKQIVDGMKSEHQREFDHSTKLKYGPVINLDNLHILAEKYKLKSYMPFLKLCDSTLSSTGQSA